MADPTQQKYPHFARRLAEAMKQAKLNNSDVARQVWGDAKDGGARNRDRIGHYLRGTSHPEPPNLQKLADALGVSPDYLAEPGNAPRRPAGVQRRGEGVVPGGTQLTITLEQPGKWRVQPLGVLMDKRRLHELLDLIDPESASPPIALMRFPG